MHRSKKGQACTKEHCFHAFDVLNAHLHKLEAPEPEFENETMPLFVTWNKESRNRASSSSSSSSSSPGSYSLRGCIGTFSEMPLHDALPEYALKSALADSRFSPIVKSELPHLQCGISLLINFEDGDDAMDWEVGKHGIRIAFKEENGTRMLSATYLPDVMKEQGWTQEETLQSLVRKAGHHGTLTPTLLSEIQLTRYQSSKCVARHSEWKIARCL